MLQKAFRDETLSRETVFHWYRLFKEGRELVEDNYYGEYFEEDK